MYSAEVECTVLEVKVIDGLGYTIDVVLVNGVLKEGDQIVVAGMQGPIVTTIRALLTPHPMKELRVKGSYIHHKEIKAAQGIKITAQGLEHAVAGTQLYVVGAEDELEDLKEEAMKDMAGMLSRIDRSGEGVCVQASTLGSLEALLEFLKSPAVSIPVSGIAIGPVHRKDVLRASVMLERKKKEYAVILAFDVKVDTSTSLKKCVKPFLTPSQFFRLFRFLIFSVFCFFRFPILLIFSFFFLQFLVFKKIFFSSLSFSLRFFFFIPSFSWFYFFLFLRFPTFFSNFHFFSLFHFLGCFFGEKKTICQFFFFSFSYFFVFPFHDFIFHFTPLKFHAFFLSHGRTHRQSSNILKLRIPTPLLRHTGLPRSSRLRQGVGSHHFHC